MEGIIEVLKAAHLRMTCPACPSQWEGATDDGDYVYIRYRNGHLSVGIGNSEEDAVDNACGWTDRAPAFSGTIGDEFDGFIGLSGVFTALAQHTTSEEERA